MLIFIVFYRSYVIRISLPENASYLVYAHFITTNLYTLKRMFLLVTKYLIPKGFRGLAVFPFVLVKYQLDKENSDFVNHERIHLRQQLELLLLPFYIWYSIEFLVRLIQYKNFDLAYKNISFEREAYAKENDLDYLKKRSFWSFFKYV